MKTCSRLIRHLKAINQIIKQLKKERPCIELTIAWSMINSATQWLSKIQGEIDENK